MTELKDIKSLAMIKMEKNFIAHLQKGYYRFPYEGQSTRFLLDRLEWEIKELRDACLDERSGTSNAKLECADISNLVDYIFERLCNGRMR